MNNKRYAVVDALRGLALLNMIVYHVIWDLVYLFDFNWQWYQSDAAYVWQQGICWTFIFLSGFCHPFSRHNLKRGAWVFLAGAVISIATILFMPESPVLFGILTLLGSSMLIAALLNPLLKRCNAAVGLLVCFLLFFFTRHISSGYLGFGGWQLIKLPENLYSSYLTAYLGFPMDSFYSTDYFALLPWFFLFTAGYFLNHLLSQKTLSACLGPSRLKPVEWAGRHSLYIYMLHQPIIYLLLIILL